MDEILGQAKDYLSDPARVARDVAERAYTTPILPGTSLKRTRERYDFLESKAVDPVREVVSLGIEEQLNPLAVAQRATSEPGGLEGLGRRFNERENNLQKRVIQAATDPLNLLPFGGVATGAARTGGRTLGRTALQTALREIAAPAAGQVVGHELGRRIGGEQGARIGETAGLLAGGFGPNLVSGQRVQEAGERAARSLGQPAPAMGIVPPEVARRQPGPVVLPDDPALKKALSRTQGGGFGRITADGLELDLERFQQSDLPGRSAIRGGVLYAVGRSRYQAAEGALEGGTQRIRGTTLFRRPLILKDTHITEGARVLFGADAAALRRDAEAIGRTANRLPLEDVLPLGVSPGSRQALEFVASAHELRRERTAQQVRDFLYRWTGTDDGFADLYPKIIDVYSKPRKGGSLDMAVTYPLMERAIAGEARARGHDAIVSLGYHTIGSGRAAYVEEVMDLREATYPTPEGGFTLRPEFAPPEPVRTLGAPAFGIAPLGRTPPKPKDTIRLYHGTGSAFDAPDAGRFDPNGLFGPGYYLTSDARVAGSYAGVRSADSSGAHQVARENAEAIQRMLADEAEIERIAAFRRQTPEQVRAYLQDGLRNAYAQLRGPNIRPVDVPRSLRLFDVDAPLSPSARRAVEQALPPEDARSLGALLGRKQTPTGDDLHRSLSAIFAQQRAPSGELSAARINRILAGAGYDGIRYSGGQRIPLKDDAGNAIEHDAYVIFPESLPKITNALSGTPGGFLPAEAAADLARVPRTVGQPGIVDVRSDLPFQPMSQAETEAFLEQLRSEPRQKLADALELNWQGALKDIFGTATPPRTLADWRRLLTSGGAAQGAAANVLAGVAQGETDPDQILENALMGAGMGVTVRRARALGAASGMPGMKGPVLGAVGDLPPGAGQTAGRPLRIAGQVGSEVFGPPRGVSPEDVRAAKAAAAAKSPLARLGIPEPPRGGVVPPSPPPPPPRGTAVAGPPPEPRRTAAEDVKARAAARAHHAADLKQTRSSILDLPRQVLVAGDVGQPLRIGVGGEIAAISAGKGLQGLSAFGRALRAAVSPGYFDELMQRPEYAKWKGSTLLKDFDKNQENLSIIQRIPGLGAVETALFQRFTPAYAVGVANALDDGMKRAGDFKHMSDAARRAVVGDWVKGLVIGRELSDPEVGRVAKAVSRFALAPRWTAGGITAVSKIADPGAQGELARRFWATAALMGVTTSVGLTAVLTGKNPADLLNPLHDDSVVDPRNGRRFLSVELPGGTLISPLQPILPLARALLRPLVEGADTYAETQSLAEAVNALVGEGLDAGRDYFTGKANVPVRMFNDIVIRQADWQGRPIVTKDWETNPLGAFGQAALYAASQNVPIFLQPVAPALEEVGVNVGPLGRVGIPGGTLERDLRLPGTEPSLMDRLAETGLSFLGVQARTPDRLPPDASAALRDVLRSRGVEPGGDGDLTRQYSALNLDPSEKASIERANPAIKEFFTARRQVWGEKYEKPAGRARVDEYLAKQGRAKAARDAALVELEQEHLPGDEYRRRRRLVLDRYAGVVDGLGEAIFETANRAELDKAMDAVFRKQGPQSAEEKALEGLYAIRQASDSLEDRDKYFADRDAYLASLPADMRAKIDQAQLDRAPTETERHYILAQREMQEYYAMPTYLGMTVEESRTANRAIQRARDRQVYEPWLKLKTLVLMDDSISSDDQINAYRAIGGKLSNPARRQWFMSRPYLAKFFSSLPAEEAALLAA